MGILETLYGVYQTGRSSAVTVAESLFLPPTPSVTPSACAAGRQWVTRVARIDVEMRGREHVTPGRPAW